MLFAYAGFRRALGLMPIQERARKQIGDEQREEDELDVLAQCDKDCENDDDADEYLERISSCDFEALETNVREAADHHIGDEHHEERQDLCGGEVIGETLGIMKHPEETQCSAGCGGDRHSEERFFLFPRSLDIEAGESKRSANREETAGRATDEWLIEIKRSVYHERRGDAEGDYIGERIQIHSKRALSSGESGDKSIEDIQNSGKENVVDGQDEITTIKGLEHGQDAAEEAACREKIWENVDLAHFDAPLGMSFANLCVIIAQKLVSRLIQP